MTLDAHTAQIERVREFVHPDVLDFVHSIPELVGADLSSPGMPASLPFGEGRHDWRPLQGVGYSSEDEVALNASLNGPTGLGASLAVVDRAVSGSRYPLEASGPMIWTSGTPVVLGRGACLFGCKRGGPSRRLDLNRRETGI